MDGYVLPGTFRFLSLLMVRFFWVVTLDVLEGDMFQDHVGGEFEVVTLNTANPLLSLPLPPVAYLFPTHLRVGWGVIQLAETVVTDLQKQLECKVGKLKYKKLEVMQPRMKKQI